MTVGALAPPLVAAAAAAGFLALWWIDRYTREPVVPFVAAVVAGAAGMAAARAAAGGSPTLLPAALATPAQGGPGSLLAVVVAHGAPAALIALLATLVVLLLCPPTRFPGLVEPLGFGVAPALGAGAVAGSAAVSAAAQRPADAVLQLLFWALAGAVVGLAIGWARTGLRWPWRAVGLVVAPLAGAAVSTGAAALMSDPSVARFVAAGYRAAAASLLPAGLVVGLVVAALWLEGRIVRAELAEEVAVGVMPEWVVHAVSSLRRRAFGEWWQPRDERRVIAQLLTRLAFRRRAMSRAGGAAARVRGLEVGRLRQRSRELLALRVDDGGPAAASEG